MDNIKMVITDLDRSLLNNDRKISDYTIKVFEKLKQKDIKIVFATARPLRNTLELFNSIMPDASICHCGAIVYIGTNPIFQKGIEVNIGKNIIENILKDYPKINYGFEIEDIFYTNFDTKIYWNNVPYEDINLYKIPQKSIFKIIVGLEEIGNVNEIKKYLSDELYFEVMDEKICLIMNKNANKWNGIKELLKYYNIDRMNTIAFGDDNVDIEMIKNCGIGAAMENGTFEIKNKENTSVQIIMKMVLENG